MFLKIIFTISIISSVCLTKITACKGCIQLDEYNIFKIIPKFKAVLVKFDVNYPYGAKHEEFEKVSMETSHISELITATVAVRDYGELENQDLATKYGITKDDFPVLKLFVNGDKENPVDFPKSDEWTTEQIISFVRDNSGVYISLPGCLKDFDAIATDFLYAKDKSAKIKEAENLSKKLNDEDKKLANMYLKIMNKITENGAQFLSHEIDRVTNLTKNGKIAPKKLEELKRRINILNAFTFQKDEL